METIIYKSLHIYYDNHVLFLASRAFVLGIACWRSAKTPPPPLIGVTGSWMKGWYKDVTYRIPLPA